MAEVLRLVREVIKPDFMFLSEQDHNSSPASPFKDRFSHSLQYYFLLAQSVECWSTEWESLFRLQLDNLLFAPGEEHFFPCTGWVDLLVSQGFTHLPFPPGMVNTFNYGDDSCFDWAVSAEARNGDLVLTCNNVPIAFTSIWKPCHEDESVTPTPSLICPSAGTTASMSIPLLPPLEDLSSYKYLYMTAAGAQLFDVLQLVCWHYKFPLALMWTPKMGADTNYELSSFDRTSYFLDNIDAIWCFDLDPSTVADNYQALGERALKLNACFLSGINKIETMELAAVSLKLRMSYVTGSDYLMEFFLFDEKREHAQDPSKLVKGISQYMQEICGSLSTVGDTSSVVFIQLEEDSSTHQLTINEVEVPVPGLQTIEMSNDAGERSAMCVQVGEPVLRTQAEQVEMSSIEGDRQGIHIQVDEPDSGRQQVKMTSVGEDRQVQKEMCDPASTHDGEMAMFDSSALSSKKRKNRSEDSSSFILENVEGIELPIQVVESEGGSGHNHPSTYEKCVKISSWDSQEEAIVTESQMECLELGGQLTTPIIEFYILHLKNCYWTNDASYKVFSTLCYSKLLEIFNEKSGEDIKFGKGWNGENIFEKRYIFVPIHKREIPHWSLVVIYNPPKHTSLPSVILYLDSLESSPLHESNSIFDMFKRFLQNELDIIGDSRKLVSKKLKVPQQTNDYDGGIYILYYMECLLKNLPIDFDDAENLKKVFHSNEPGTLRHTIKYTLKEMFDAAAA